MAGDTPRGDRPNILYIMTDQQRFDSLSRTGLSGCRTPHLDELAGQGVAFDNAYSVCSLCSPARASMLTGLYPHNHRMWNNNDMMQWAVRNLPDDVRLISQDLRQAGYRCGYIGKWHCGESKLPSTYGFEGMDVPNYGDPYATEAYSRYLEDRGLVRPTYVPLSSPADGPGMLSGPPEACAPHFLAEFTIDLLHRFNEERGSDGTPFLIFLSFWGPHVSYHVPEPYASMYDPLDIEPWPSWREELSGKPRIQARRARLNADISEKRLRNMLAKHWAFCSFIDDEIGRVLDALGAAERSGDTAVFFSVDHGNMIGSHGGLQDKGPWMYEETYHIPLIARVPWLARAGRVCRRLVSNMDPAATILDLAGLPVPGNLDGRSLTPLLRDPDSEWQDDLMAEFHGHRFLYTQRMIRWQDYKYVFTPGDTDELYDLDSDPGEMENRIRRPEYAAIVREARRRLMRWFEDTRDPLGSEDICWELENTE